MRATNPAPAWLAAMGVWIAAGCTVMWAIVRRLPYDPDPRYQFDLAYGLKLPLPVVADHTDGWKVLACFWAFVAGLAWLGLRLAAVARDSSSRASRWVGWAMAGAAVGLAFFPVLLEGDPYAYVAYGRLYGVYGINPYILTHSLRPDAVLAQCFAFYGNPPPGDDYGPLFTLLAGAIGRLEAGASLILQVCTYRALGIASLALTALGLLRILRAAGERQWPSRLARFGFHPLVLYEGCAAGHNDLLMLAPLIWSFALVDEYPFVAGLLAGASMAIKYVAAVALPFLVVQIARRSGMPWATLSAAIAVAVVGLTFFPFWTGQQTLRPLFDQLSAYRPSPAWLIAVVFYLSGSSATLAVSHVAGVATLVAVMGAAGLGVVIAAAIRYARIQRYSEVFRATTASLWASASIHPWYALWLSPALAAKGTWSTYGWWFGLLMFAQYTQDVLRHPESPSADRAMIAALVCLTLIAYGLPVALALLGRRHAMQVRALDEHPATP